MKETLIEIATDDRTGYAAAAGAILIGIADALTFINNHIGTISMWLGAILAFSLIIIHWRGEIRNTRIENERKAKKIIRKDKLIIND